MIDKSLFKPMARISDLKELVDNAAKKYGEKTAYKTKVKNNIECKTFIDLKNDSNAFSNAVSSLGIKGNHIAVIGASSYKWIVTYFGTVNSNSVIVPIDKELPSAEICKLIKRADVVAVVFDKLTYNSIQSLITETDNDIKYFISLDNEDNDGNILSFDKLIQNNYGENNEIIDNEKMSTILFTSGTTGESKGVMLTHKSLCDNVTCLEMNINPESVILSVLPIHHAYCFTCDILLGIFLGITVCFNDSIMRIAKNLSVFKPTIMLLVPMIIESLAFKLNELAKENPQAPKPVLAQMVFGGNLTTIFSGGAYLNPKLVDVYSEFGIELLQGYGMTESSPRIACNMHGYSKKESIGAVVPGCEVKILDGEICAKSDSVMLGYYKNPTATSETLIDGWLHTGDLGYLDEDNFLYITGRKKNLIILSNGENVSPEELENYFNGFYLAKELLVYSENNVITVEVFPNTDIADAMGITDIKSVIEQKVNEINKDLPLYKRINAIKLRNTEFEKTASKKIKRKYCNL